MIPDAATATNTVRDNRTAPDLTATAADPPVVAYDEEASATANNDEAPTIVALPDDHYGDSIVTTIAYDTATTATAVVPQQDLRHCASSVVCNDDASSIPVARAHIMNSTRSSLGSFSVNAVPYPAAAATTTTHPSTTLLVDDWVDENGVVTVTATKPTPDTKVGLGLGNMRSRGGGVVITSFKTYSIFNGTTNLRVGMKILRINGCDCSNNHNNNHNASSSAEHCAMLLRSIIGNVTIVAADVTNNNDAAFSDPAAAADAASAIIPTVFPDVPLMTAVIMKPNPESKVGITVYDKALPGGNHHHHGATTKVPVISKLTGLCADTSLQPGMRLLCINGIAYGGRDDAVAMIQRANVGAMSITAGPLRMVAATVTKATQDTKVGLNMRRRQRRNDNHGNPNNNTTCIFISALARGGLFDQTDLLKEGMRVLQINGVDVDGLAMAEILNIIATAQGTVTVLAEEEEAPTMTPGKGSGEDGPPPGAPAGGSWGTAEFFGPQNSLAYCFFCAICGIFGLCTLFCAMDTAAFYRAPDGRVYDIHGKCIGTESSVRHFRHNPPGVTGPQQDLPVSEIETSCGPNYKHLLVGAGTSIFLVWFVLVLVFRIISEGDDDDDYYRYSDSECKYMYCYEWNTCYDLNTNSYESCYEYIYVYRCGGC